MKALRYILVSAIAVAMFSCNGSSKTESTETDTIAAVTDVADPAEDAVYEFQAEDEIPALDIPVVIDFNATWCGPCQKFGPVFHAVAAEYGSKAKFAAADVDVCGKLAETYKIQSIPAVVIIYPKDSGKEPVTSVGYMEENDFKAFLDANL